MMNEFWTNRTPSTVLQTTLLAAPQVRRESREGQSRRWERTTTYVACKATSLDRQFNAFTTSRSYSL